MTADPRQPESGHGLSAARVASRLVVGLAGPRLSPTEEAWLERWRPAGVILFARNVTGPGQLRNLCRRLHVLDPVLEISADHEGGPVCQLAAAAGRPPAAWSLGSLDDPDLTRRVHRETGARLRDLGLDRVLAPCADVLTEAANPVIGARAFGAETETVDRHVAAAVTGLREAGLAVCLKHWPGHGGSRQDSHLGSAEPGDGGREEPFRHGLEAGADAVMIAHIGPAGGLPASLDRVVLTAGRERLTSAADSGIRLYADDVTMGALRPAMSALGVPVPAGSNTGMVEPDLLSVAWLTAPVAAGCDCVLVRGIPWGAFPAGHGGSSETVAVESSGDEPVFPDATLYAETRRRAARQARVADFATAAGTLLWVDLTGGDRWEVAGGHSPGSRARLTAALAADFAAVETWSGETRATGESTGDRERLLVTSHRPLPAMAMKSGAPWNRLAPTGRCLVMGHPGLAAAVSGLLGDGWTVGAVFDTTPEDYLG